VEKVIKIKKEMKEFLEGVLSDHLNLVVHDDLDAVEELHDALHGNECPLTSEFSCLDYEETVDFYSKKPFIVGDDVTGCEFCASFHDPDPESPGEETWQCLKKHVDSNEWRLIKIAKPDFAVYSTS